LQHTRAAIALAVIRQYNEVTINELKTCAREGVQTIDEIHDVNIDCLDYLADLQKILGFEVKIDLYSEPRARVTGGK